MSSTYTPRSRSRAGSYRRTPRSPRGSRSPSSRRPSGSVKTGVASGSKRGVETEFVRVPEGGRLQLPEGTVVELVGAEYRVEDKTHRGVQKDVKSVIAAKIFRGGIDIAVTNKGLGIDRDPYPGRAKVLVITYIPRSDLGIIEMTVPEGGMFQLAENTIEDLLSAEYKLPYDEFAGHGWAVDVYGPVASHIRNGGISAMLVSRETLKVPYDPFPGRPKILKVQYLPTRKIQPRWDSLHTKTAWAIREVDETVGLPRTAYHPVGNNYYAKDVHHPPGVVMSRGTDSYHIQLLDAVLCLLKDVERYGVASDTRLQDVTHLLQTVQIDRHNRIAAAATHLTTADPHAPFWSSPHAVLTRMGFTPHEASTALHRSNNSLPAALQHLAHPHTTYR